jgi:hypothetical protein
VGENLKIKKNYKAIWQEGINNKKNEIIYIINKKYIYIFILKIIYI